MLKIGTETHDFEVKLNTGDRFRLSNHRGKKNVVLFFYPKDFTWFCTKEVCSFSDHYDQLSSFDALILGISADNATRHEQFAGAYHLRFPLASDTDRTVARLYNVLLFRLRTKRLTYVIDKHGVIRGAVHHEIIMDNHWRSVEQILRMLDQS